MIRFENLTQHVAASTGTGQVLRGVNLTIPADEIFGIVGYSRAGRSTPVRIVNLLERPDEGNVSLACEQIADARGEIQAIVEDGADLSALLERAGFRPMPTIFICRADPWLLTWKP